jgi:hypothetical protein
MANLTPFSTAKKEHLRYKGANTECNRSTSGIGANDIKVFTWWAENHPENCCQKCLNRFNQIKDRNAKKH